LRWARIALVLVGAAAGAFGKENGSMTTKTAVKLELLSTSPRVVSGQPVNVTAQLRNTGSGEVWVNKRMLLNTAHAPASMREVWLEVTGPDGQGVPFSCKIRAGQAQADDYELLGPNDTIPIQLDLTECFDFKETGSYRIQASYQDGTPDAPAAPAGVKHLVDRLDSAVLTIEVRSED
jgi:hypothetical protein